MKNILLSIAAFTSIMSSLPALALDAPDIGASADSVAWIIVLPRSAGMPVECKENYCSMTNQNEPFPRPIPPKQHAVSKP